MNLCRLAFPLFEFMGFFIWRVLTTISPKFKAYQALFFFYNGIGTYKSSKDVSADFQ